MKNKHSKIDNRCDLDRPIWGARNIGIEAGLGDDKKAWRRAFYLLENGLLPAKKVGGCVDDEGRHKGGRWVSTPRLIRQALNPVVEA